jgi:hypothetical protein
MADDWKPGDLALCVKKARNKNEGVGYAPGCAPMQKGGVYRVESVVWVEGLQGLVIEHHYSKQAHCAFLASAFKRIHPHTPDAEDAETIRLLTGAPVQELSA